MKKIFIIWLFSLLVFPKGRTQSSLQADRSDIFDIPNYQCRVILYGRFKGTHLGELNGIAPTYKAVELPLAVGYKIENNKVVDHWLVINQMVLMEQLGVANVTA
jgi:predicted ester cyclase